MEDSTALIQLINKDSFSSDWEIVDPDGPSSSWSFSPQGSLKQTVSVGSAKDASGTFAVLKNPISLDIPEVRLTCQPGASFQVGMVFCFADRNNCVIFSLEQLGPAFQGHYVLVNDLKSGASVNLLKRFISSEVSGPVTLVVRQEGKNIVLLLGSEPVWMLLDKSLKGQKLGLYSQKNTDGLFLGLTLKSLPPPSVPALPAPPATVTATPAPQAQSLLPLTAPPPPPAESAVLPFLKIKEPNALSIIEFKEPFRVSLDSLYSSLYLNSQLARPKEQSPSARPTRSLLLDVRPKRWYREYKNIKDAIRLAQLDLTRATAVLNGLENGGKYPDGAEAAKHDADIREARKKYLVAQDVLERLVQARNNLLQEMRVAGYVVHKERVPEEMAELGYDFFIAGGIPGYKDFEPIDFDPSLDFGDDGQWNGLESRLRERLFANPRFAPSSKERYLSKLEPLKTRDQYLPHLKKDLDAIEGELSLLKSSLPQLEKQLGSVQSEIERWKEDRKVLEESHINFRPYTGGDYPVEGGGPGPENSAKFRSWLANHVTAFRNFSYKFAATGCDYSVAIDKYETFEWSQDYSIRVEETKNIVRWVVYSPWDHFWHPELEDHPEYEYVYRYHYTFKGDPEIRNFFDTAIRICDAFIDQYLPQEVESLQTRIATLKNNRTGVELRKQDFEANGLRLAREGFVDDWNRASIMETMAIGEKVIGPSSDPLTDLIAEIETEGESAKIYTIEYRSDGYYTQDGQSLLDFVAVAERLPHLPILLLPVFDRHGSKLEGVSNAVVNPVRSSKVIKLPSITFVETYRTEVRWKGYCIGQLTQTINLFPGEKKELVIEHSTKLAEKLSLTEASETSRSTTVTRSFEEQLQQELSEKNETALTDSVTNENERKQEVSHVITDEVSVVDRLALTFNAGKQSGTDTSVGGRADQPGVGSVSGTKNTKKSDTSGLNFESSKTSTTGHNDVKSDALTISQKQASQKSNKESKETLKKAVSNVINKAASEASENNKVSFTSATSRELESTASRKETIHLENPNVGRTVNYHLFQAQNIFETKTALIDVKIVLDPGIETVKYSDLTDLRVFDLEEFGRIYFNSDVEDPRIAVLSAIVARQVFKTYGSIGGKPGSADAIRFTDVVPMDDEMYNVLNLSFPWNAEGALDDTLVAPLRKALTYLKSMSLKFNEVDLIPPAVHTVNSGSYYMDAEVGLNPATEKYLEDRRDIQTEKQRAEIEEMRARIKEGVFHQPLPAGLTTLSLNNISKPVELTASVEPAA